MSCYTYIACLVNLMCQVCTLEQGDIKGNCVSAASYGPTFSGGSVRAGLVTRFVYITYCVWCVDSYIALYALSF